jgi:hypothetical protein
MDKAIAYKRYLFVQGGILIRDWFSDKLKKEIYFKLKEYSFEELPIQCI